MINPHRSDYTPEQMEFMKRKADEMWRSHQENPIVVPEAPGHQEVRQALERMVGECEIAVCVSIGRKRSKLIPLKLNGLTIAETVVAHQQNGETKADACVIGVDLITGNDLWYSHECKLRPTEALVVEFKQGEDLMRIIE